MNKTKQENMNPYEPIQHEAYQANMQLPKLGLVLFTFGNVSAADGYLLD